MSEIGGDKAKDRGLTDEQWVDLRNAYEQSAESISSLSRRFSVARNTLKDHIKKESWTRTDQAIDHMVNAVSTTPQEIVTAIRAKVVDIATGKAVEIAEKNGGIDELAANVAQGLLRHAEVETLLLDIAVDTLERVLGRNGKQKLRPGPASSEASEIKDAVATAKAALDASRDVNGKRLGQPSAVLDGKGNQRRFEFIVTNKKKPDVTALEEAG